ncbi:MAG: hypothetical protein IKK75_10045 [Clostridia bacterium]|nr:hypothetical protein [Clostridia bacterium]
MNTTRRWLSLLLALLLTCSCSMALGSGYPYPPNYPWTPDSNLPEGLFFLATASSEYHLKYNTEYQVDASMAVDNDLKTAWNEGAPGTGVGEWIILFPADGRTYTYQGFQIANGFQYHDYYKGDRWIKNNRVKFLQVFDDQNSIVGAFQIMDLSDGYQTIYFDTPVTTQYLKFQIMGAWQGEQHPETCISELRPF